MTTVASLFLRYHQTAVRRCARRIGDVALAEDAVQEVYIQVLQRLQHGDGTLLDPDPEVVMHRNAHWAASKLTARDRPSMRPIPATRLAGRKVTSSVPS